MPRSKRKASKPDAPDAITRPAAADETPRRVAVEVMNRTFVPTASGRKKVDAGVIEDAWPELIAAAEDRSDLRIIER